MKKLVVFSVVALAFATSGVFATPPAGYTLKWSDEFAGSTLDTSNWAYEVGRGSRNDGWGNWEMEYYTAGANLTFNNGICVNEARQETGTGDWTDGYQGGNYTSTRMTTYNKMAFKYGYIEVRLKAPKGNGLWPAFWTLGTSNYDPNVGWPACGEMELYEQRTGTWSDPTLSLGAPGDNYFIGTCHFANPDGTPQYNFKGKALTEALGNDFHTFAILWDSLHVQYYLDDVIYWPSMLTPNINQPNNFDAFHNPHYLISNIAVKGNYVNAAPGDVLDPSTLPAQMSIDYVRLYQDSKGQLILGNSSGSAVKQKINRTSFIAGLVKPASAECKVYDMRGRLVADFTNKVRAMSVGANPIKKLGALLPTGTYVVRLTDNEKVYSQKLATTR